MTSQPLWKAEDVIRALRGQCLHEQTWNASGISIDSRSLKPGDLFVALKGPVHDGHDHVAQAIAAGAAAAIVSRQPPQAPADAPLVFVEDTFTAMQALGQAGRNRMSGKIIAVTGSVGKTSTKEMLRIALGATGTTYATDGNLNNHWGVPLSLSRLPGDAQYGVFELGMNHAGELTELSPQVRPHIAMITNIEAVHLEFFGSLEAIADAKAEIFVGVQPQGTVILNRDNRQYARLAAAAKAHGIKNILTFGRDPKCDARLLDCVNEANGSVITIDMRGQRELFRLGAPGEHLALNAVATLLAASVAGSDILACAEALARYRQPKGRGVIETLAVADGDITLIDESYNASPVAVGFAARVLGQMNPPAGGRKILVLGDMRELGDTAPALHAALAKDIAAAKVDLVYCCGELMAHLFEALPHELRGGHAADSTALAPLLTAAVHAGDIVTVKGSKSMEMSKIVNGLREASAEQSHRQLAG